MSDMRLVIAGAAGRMGRVLVRLIQETPGLKLSGAIEPEGHVAIGEDAGLLAGAGRALVQISSNADLALGQADGIIDFTIPAVSVELAGLAAKHRKVHVIGTTGFSVAEEEAIASSARMATIMKSGNYSLGVNLLQALVKKAAAALDEDFDIEIVEMHHNKKIDAPSGTALMFGEAAAAGRGIDLAQQSERGRDGHTGPRKRGAIGFAALRGGTVVGDHTVTFAGPAERISLSHFAEDRGLFARGALKAAIWAKGKPAGLYSMADVLGLTDL
ncbi:4-hydroxy-tetrahydrodipicolinate reductase [Phreatobacter aquaticus]|uniref:4-hydroxy-tetrahydrodipicolinate reductase n=1 Tax=Phreatobacter aquaticus TaxID=2570229 RepID=A0A4D7QDJ8_9HYPH|nr:4-hydroxy-tetrahydrodipicolinate reductase [Phreatobacter aquaticus]QCK84725.1 4-hydroxy-tetrahydrodipicolinate reductase [Phreatobacter aquaticus]